MSFNLTVQIIIEAVSVVLCIILSIFMAKPYKVLRERKYLGLPVGFTLLSFSFFFATTYFFGLTNAFEHNIVFSWFADVCRSCAYIALASTYFFSTRFSKNTKITWNLLVGLIILAIITLSLFRLFNPPLATSGQVYLRITCIIMLAFISVHTLKSYIEKTSARTLLVPLGFVLLMMSQYSFIFLLESRNAVWAGYAFRLAGLAVFLVIAFRNFYMQKESIK